MVYLWYRLGSTIPCLLPSMAPINALMNPQEKQTHTGQQPAFADACRETTKIALIYSSFAVNAGSSNKRWV